MCQSNEKGSLSFSMWQRSQAGLTVHARFRLSVLGYLYSPFSYERRASCCSPTCASGARFPLKRSDPEAFRRPSHLPRPTSDTPPSQVLLPHHSFLLFSTFASRFDAASDRTSSLLPCASSVGTAVREIGFYSRMYTGIPHSYKHGAGRRTGGP